MLELLHSPEFFYENSWLKGSEDYDQGWFIEKSTRLYVLRGIGTSILP